MISRYAATRRPARRQRAAQRPATAAEELFWDLAEPLLADPAVQRSTMMGLPACGSTASSSPAWTAGPGRYW